MKSNFCISLLLFVFQTSFAQRPGGNKAIYSGIPWYDDRGKAVSAHGANIIKEKNRFYLFGEAHTDSSNDFAGFNCYSSADLYSWKFEKVALPVQPNGKLGPKRIGERPKVLKCPSTGEYIMFMHVDTLGYVDQFVGYATSKTITGPYNFKGPLLFNNKPIRKWDMGTFQDKDGAGYILIHGGEIFKLSEDYKSVIEQVSKAITTGFESPAIFRKDSIYYFLGSHLTGWERNDNYYFTASSLKGPWTRQGYLAPEGTQTWNSQTTFVLPIEGNLDTTYLFMGDRWSFPRQASAATYVWQPLQVSGLSLSLPEYRESWQINIETGINTNLELKGKVISAQDKRVMYSGKWEKDTLSVYSSDEKNASFSVKIKGKRIGLYGLARPDGGYARITINDSKGKTILTSNVDMYCKYPISTFKFLSPILPNDSYTVTVSVLGENWYWMDKKKNRSGSKGYFVSLDRIVVVE